MAEAVDPNGQASSTTLALCDCSRVKSGSFQIYVLPETQNVTLFTIKLFADIIR